MRIAILGATGLVGRETIDLCSRAWPQAQLDLYASRDQSLELANRHFAVRAANALDQQDAARGHLAFVALDDEYSARYVPRLLQLGYRVVDKSNTYRQDPAVILGVAGVNSDLITETTQLVANPNCTTIPLTLALAPLQAQFGLVSVQVSTYQAISGAGLQTLDEFLAACRMGYSETEPTRSRLGLAHSLQGYAGNTVPHHGKTDDSGFSAEERKLSSETPKILRLPGLQVSAQCCRVPVAVGHYENCWVRLARPASLTEIEARIAQAPFVRLHPGSAGASLSALAAVHDRDRALVGRIRFAQAGTFGDTVCLTVVGDNLRLGAATNAVRLGSRWYASSDAELQA
jgi:aspartate-semialdehyde dehydrogenase